MNLNSIKNITDKGKEVASIIKQEVDDAIEVLPGLIDQQDVVSALKKAGFNAFEKSRDIVSVDSNHLFVASSDPDDDRTYPIHFNVFKMYVDGWAVDNKVFVDYPSCPTYGRRSFLIRDLDKFETYKFLGGLEYSEQPSGRVKFLGLEYDEEDLI